MSTQQSNTFRDFATESEFMDDLLTGVYGPRQGGARIIIDAQNAATGVAKTSLACGMARGLSDIFGYELEKDDFTLSGEEYLNRWREHPGQEQPSVIVLDELAGAGAGGARRSMSTQNVNLGRSWQLMRKKRVVTLTTLPHWGDADAKMRRFADYRLWCLAQPIGYFLPYKVTAGFADGDERVRGYDEGRIGFPNYDALNDEFYQHVTAKKDELLESRYFDADKLAGGETQQETMDPDEARKEERIEIAQDLRDSGKSLREIADVVGMSRSWCHQNTETPTENDE